jgi:secretion/DNA translocation related TadE-like protein
VIAGMARGGLLSRRHDAGSATIWVLATGMVLVLVAVALAMAGAASVARHRAQAAADLTALAAALRAWDGEAAACQRAADVSARNGARLVACRLEGLDAVVAVEVAPALLAGIGVARAAARAGPVESSGHPGIGRAGPGEDRRRGNRRRHSTHRTRR